MKAAISILLLFFTMQLASGQAKFYSADQFPLIGKISNNTQTLYERLPGYLEDISRPPVWQLGKNTSGLAVRFRSNSTSIFAKWQVLFDNNMNHMTDTGIKGLDLYAWENEKWQFVNTARPTVKNNEQVIIANMLPQNREYLLYLPLYDGITDLSIGIDSLASIESPILPFPVTQNPVICYGTSITQGGCATRPGMSYTNILGRKLNREVINLGFSGNGQLDYEIAELMGNRTDAGLFVLDFIPNVNLGQIQEKTATFVKKLREKNPQIPILFVESIIFPHSVFDKKTYKTVTEKNNALRQEFKKLKQNGYKNLYYLSSEKLIGNDGETTIDGVHLTDLGFIRMADEMGKTIRRIIK